MILPQFVENVNRDAILNKLREGTTGVDYRDSDPAGILTNEFASYAENLLNFFNIKLAFATDPNFMEGTGLDNYALHLGLPRDGRSDIAYRKG